MSRLKEEILRPRLSVVVILLSVALGISLGTIWQQSASRPALAQPALGNRSALRALQQGFVSVAKQVGPAVVNISTESKVAVPTPEIPPGMEEFFRRFFGETPTPRGGGQETRRSLGSGVIISRDGDILTNVHVIRGADKIQVTLENGDQYPAKLVASDPRTDLAVIKIQPRHSLPAADLGDADQVQVGEWALAIGSPFGFSSTVTSGVISAKGRALPGDEQARYSNLLQTDAAINRGNSGGPLVDLDGRVIGINVAIFSPTGGNIGIGFAIPINGSTRRVISSLMAGRVPVRGRLGVEIRDLPPAMAERLGIKGGVLVRGVVPGTPAAKAGIQDGDVITSLNDHPVTTADQLVSAVEASKPGSAAAVRLIRNGKALTKTVIMGQLTQETAAAPGEAQPGRLGMTVDDITPDLVDRYRLRVDAGVVVTAVDQDGDAAGIGIRQGDVITRINGLPIRSMEDYQRALAGIKSGDSAEIRWARGNQFFTDVIEGVS